MLHKMAHLEKLENSLSLEGSPAHVAAMRHQVFDTVYGIPYFWEGEVGHQVAAVCGQGDDDEQPPEAHQDPAGDGLREMDAT